MKEAELLFEVALLKKIYRTGYAYLGSGKETVASHTFGVAFVAWVLARLCNQTVDESKLLKMALLHDLVEARTGDFNAVNKLYDQADEERAIKDAVKGTVLEKEALSLWKEYRSNETLEAKLVHDADVIDLLVQLKEQQDLGNPYAPKWIFFAKKKLLTPWGKELAEKVLSIEWCSWWLKELIKENET